MKKIAKNKTITLMAIGMFTMASSSVIVRYFAMQDFAKGATMGVGIGIVLLALIIGDFKSKTTK